MRLPRWVSLAPVVPQDWTQVTPAWMNRALRRRFPDAVVSRVTLLGSDDGTNRRARFALDYALGAGPERVFLKAHAAAHRWVHWRNGNLFGESRLFASGARLPLEHPDVFHAVPDYPRLDFLLVMEDLALRGAEPRDSLHPLTPAQAEHGLAGLAALHRTYLDFDRGGDRRLRWVKPWRPTQGWQVGLRKHVPIGLKRAAGQLPDEVARLDGDAIVDLWVAYVRTLADRPHTLLHGDAHVGNVYTLPGGEVGFLDWQVVRRGHWSQDFGYFLIGALGEDDCRTHERRLVEGYAQALGPAMPDAGEAWTRYRLAPIYGLAIWLSTLGTDGWQPHPVSLALAKRYAAAFVAHETAALLAG